MKTPRFLIDAWYSIRGYHRHAYIPDDGEVVLIPQESDEAPEGTLDVIIASVKPRHQCVVCENKIDMDTDQVFYMMNNPESISEQYGKNKKVNYKDILDSKN